METSRVMGMCHHKTKQIQYVVGTFGVSPIGHIIGLIKVTLINITYSRHLYFAAYVKVTAKH